MERLVTVNDMCERYGVTMKTARKYIRQMFHYESPLAAPRWALDEWEKGRECCPGNAGKNRFETIRNGRTIVPRKRG